MGGLGPGIGGFELVVIGIVALLVVGPKDLPILMRRVGQMVAKARGMANEFRASFDEMARQSELDDLRKEVEQLRTGQNMYPLGKEADAAFKEINAGLSSPSTPSALAAPQAADDPAVMKPATDEWPDNGAMDAHASGAGDAPISGSAEIEPAASVPPTSKPKPSRKAAVKPKAKVVDAGPVKVSGASGQKTSKPATKKTKTAVDGKKAVKP